MRDIMTVHNIEPVYDKQSRILILGSFPSVKSREAQFFYAHRQNRFWKVLAAVFACDVPQTVGEKKRLLLENHIALWDVIASCEITGSSDTSIKNVVPNDLSVITDTAKIEAVFCNGTKAFDLYNRFIYPNTGKPAVKLPSTSPANAAKSLDELTKIWKEALRTVG